MSGALLCSRLDVAPGGAPVLRGVDLEVAAGALTVLVGPSGAGKTTLLRAIGGLEPPRSGSIRLGGRDIARLPAHRRRISLVFQEPRLLDHLDVVANVELPLRAAGVSRHERRRRAVAMLDRVGLGGMAGRAVRGLSGGEQQRVSLARALVGDPELLLLDEPLAAVDANRRESLRLLIAELQAERRLTTLLVTHDRAEAAQLGTSIALMLEGRIVQQGEPRELFERPRSVAIAHFFGAVNVLRGEVRGGMLHLGPDLAVVAGGDDGPATCVIRPEAVVLGPGGLRATVRHATYMGTYVRLRLRAGPRDFEAHVPATERVAAGDDVGVELPREALWRIPDETGTPAAPEGQHA